jgi:hypothetical protein
MYVLFFLFLSFHLHRFCDVYTEEKGWILKLPYIANSRVVSCGTRKEIFEELERLGKQKGREFKLTTRDVASHIMLQPTRMCNKREIKVACLFPGSMPLPSEKLSLQILI